MTLIKERDRYAAAAIFTAFFSIVYEMFSHQVYSGFMLCAFLFPLVGGVIPFSFLAISGRPEPSVLSRCLYGSGIAALTAGSIFRGVLEIYGTTSRLSAVYWLLGGSLVLLGLLIHFTGRKSS